MTDSMTGQALLRLLLDNPHVQAVQRAAAEQAAQPPFEESEGFKLECGKVRALLADVPAAPRKALTQARARLAETEAALAGMGVEQSRIQVARTFDNSSLDRWVKEAATAGQRSQALIAAHAQATEEVERATRVVLAAMMEVAEQRRAKFAAETDKARAAVRGAQAAVKAAYDDEQAASALGVRIRDNGLNDQYIGYVMGKGYSE